MKENNSKSQGYCKCILYLFFLLFFPSAQGRNSTNARPMTQCLPRITLALNPGRAFATSREKIHRLAPFGTRARRGVFSTANQRLGICARLVSKSIRLSLCTVIAKIRESENGWCFWYCMVRSGEGARVPSYYLPTTEHPEMIPS